MRKLKYELILKKITSEYLNEIIEEVSKEFRKKNLKTLISNCDTCGPFGPPPLRYHVELNTIRLMHAGVDGGGLSILVPCPNEELYTNAIWQRLDPILGNVPAAQNPRIDQNVQVSQPST